MHWDASLHVQAAEALDGSLGGLSEQGEGHQEPTSTMRLGGTVDALVVLQGFVEAVLKAQHRVPTLNVLCVWRTDRTGQIGCTSDIH